MSVFKKRNKYWILYRLPNRKWRREPVGTSYALAKEVEAKRKAEVAEGRYFPERIADKRTFQSISDQYFKLHGPNLRSTTWKYMSPRINKYFAAKPICNITPEDIQCFYSQIEAATSTSTANRYLTLISAVFNKAKVWGNFHRENPCKQVKKKQEPNNRTNFLLDDKIRILLENCSIRLYPIVACAIMTGMRRTEIRTLDWQDIDFTNNTIHVIKSKSGKTRRIPIMPQLRQIFLNLTPKPSGSVFSIPDITIKRHFALALEASNIDSFRFHDLRHTFASHYAMKLKDIPALQRILGHATIQMTLRYAHLSDTHIADQMNTLSKALPIEICNKPPTIAPLIAPPLIKCIQI